jgi:Tfp pilus assembly protein PilE
MSTVPPYFLPSDTLGVELSQEHYEALVAVGVTWREPAVVVAAAAILKQLDGTSFRSMRKILAKIHGRENVVALSTEKRARAALVKAGLIVAEGNTVRARYRLATAADRAATDEAGFSLIDVVVTVAIIIALSVGGFLGYQGLVSQAKQGAVDYAASNVWNSVAVYEQDGDPTTTACTAIDEYNSNGEKDDSGIKVSLTVPTPGNPSGPGLVYIGQGEANTYSC